MGRYVRGGARLIAAAALLAAVPLLGAAPAGANVTMGPCHGTAIINGKTYTPANDTPGNPVVIPDKGTILYHGDTGGVITAPHNGYLQVQIGPVSPTIYSWKSKNENKKPADDGQQSIDSVYSKLPFGIAGIYKVTGAHFNNGAPFCAGFAYVKFAKSPLSTPVGLAALIGTIVMGLGVAAAAYGGRP